jgi:signal transduction histidine kinase
MPEGHLPVVSYLAVPVMSKGNVVIGGLFFGHSSEGMFLEEHENLVAAIASQASIALDNAMLYEEIHALNSKKDEFIGFASHELKTPLTTIKGYLQLAEITETSAKEFFPKINKQVARLEAIIADLLDISKIQAGRLDLHFVKTTLNSLIQEAIESLDFSRHKIEADIPSEDVSITIDNQKMSQVLVNLLTNALKYSKPHSRILVTAIRLGDQVRISVSDEGVGIAAAHLEKIFNQFYRIYSTSNSAKGMGLGLYISKEIMEAHLGKIWAESIEKKGSTFHIQFPIDRAKGLS